MALNDLPAAIQSVIQQGYLERRFETALRAKLGFRAVADREPFGAGIGETVTKTRPGLLPLVTTPMAPAQVTDFTSGLTNQTYGVEQYTLGIAQYPGTMQLNVATATVAIDDLFLQNAENLGEQAQRSIDALARNALFDTYMGGNTRVSVTLGAPATTVRVDDVRGFFASWTAQNVPTAVSATNTLTVVVGSNTYTLTGCQADGTVPANLNLWMSNLTFSGSGSNTSTTPGGYSGTLTFSTNVSTADGTAGNQVQAAVAPVVIRPTVASTNIMCPTTAAISSSTAINNGKLTMEMLLAGMSTHETNGVQGTDATGDYLFFVDPVQALGLYNDPAFQRFFIGNPNSPEFRSGVIAKVAGCSVVKTNMSFVQNLAGVGIVHRGILVGKGALVEGEFTPTAAAAAARVDDASMMTMVDGVAHVTREPVDALKQVITQSWYAITGFAAPTDILTNPTTIPTANNAAWKRALIIESL